METHPARALWQLFEPFHAVVYFAKEKRHIYADAGLKGGWMGYFASRSAAMGPVGAEVVTATFYNFHPAMVARAIPDAWRFSSVERVLTARLEIVDLAMRRLLGDVVNSDEVAEAAKIGRDAALSLDYSGRPLFAAHAALEPAGAPHLDIWQVTTMMREHRGDGHVSALVGEGVDGCEANVLMAAAGFVSEDEQKTFRGWSDDEWDDAKERLRDRGWLDGNGLTPEGIGGRTLIEAKTDELAAPMLDALGKQGLKRFSDVMLSLRQRLMEQIPFPNPIGLPDPAVSRSATAGATPS
jgi:hypothetical protein